MTKSSVFLGALFALGFIAPAQADQIVLDWNSVEIDFFENIDASGELKNGLAVYVPGSRIATSDDFHVIIPEFCSSRLEGVLKFASQIEEVAEISLIKFQIDFYGPEVGENQTYVGRSATIDLANGKCSL